MKKRKLLARFVEFFVAVVVVLVIVFFVANSGDAVLDPAVAAVLENKPVVSKEAELAREYMTGLHIPIGEDPADFGKTVAERARRNPDEKILPCTQERTENCFPKYSKSSLLDGEPALCKSKAWCPREDILKDELAQFVEKNSPYLERYKKIVSLGEYTSNATIVINGSNIFNFLRLSKLQQRVWNQKLVQSKNLPETARSVVSEIQQTNQFLIKSLKNPQTILEAQIFFLILRSNRQFLVEAAQSEPKLKDVLKTAEFQNAREPIVVDFKNIATLVRDQELRGVAFMLKGPLTAQSLGLADLDEATNQLKQTFLNSILDAAVQKGFLFNDSMNKLYAGYVDSIAQVEKNDASTEAMSRRSYKFNPRNIVGANVVAMVSNSVKDNFHNMKNKIEKLREPLSFEGND